MVKKVGLIAFCNDGGLGAQTRRLAKMLKPDVVMVIDSSGFSKNKQKHYEWYAEFNHFIVEGLPGNNAIELFLQNLTHAFVVENPYNFGLVYWGQKQGTKIFVQSNYEFCENLSKPWLPVPDKFLMPSHWMVDDMEKRFGKDKVGYLPPPIDPAEFEKARDVNFNRRGKKRRFLHLIGTAAMQDRNGTLDLIDSIKLTKTDFELVIRSQHPLSMDIYLDDPRVTYEVNNWAENWELYSDFDALLLPRRWGGLCLPMLESLMSGLPVLMSDITPNKEILPSRWLAPANRMGTFMAQSEIPYYSVGHGIYAELIEQFTKMSEEVVLQERKNAFEIALNNFSVDALKPKYLELFDNGQS